MDSATATTKENAMDTLIARTRQMDTATILEAVAILGGGHLEVEGRMARAALLDVYEEREGGEALDSLMDCLGM